MLTLIRKTFRLLAPDERRKALAICAAVVAAALFEVLSVIAIMPFMAVISSPDGGRSLRLVQLLRDALSPASDGAFTLVVGAFAVGLLLLSASLSLVTRHALLAFSYTRYHTLSQRLFAHYLSRHYAFFLSQSSSRLSESVIADCETIVSKVILGLMIVFSNAVVALGILLAVVLVEPVLALMSFLVVGGLYLLTYRFFRLRVLQMGQQLQAVNEAHLATVHQAFRSIKELKVFGAEHFFLKRYAVLSQEQARTTGHAVALAELPRKVIETITIGGALALMLVLAASRGSVHELIPLIALFVFAAYRLLPAMQQIFQHVVKIRFYAPTVDHVYAVLNEAADPVQAADVATAPGIATAPGVPAEPGIATAPLAGDICFDQVTFRYPQADQPALDAVSLRIPAGSVAAFVGATGSGKTTAVGVLLGLLTPDQGRVWVGGVAVAPDNIRRWQHSIGYVPQAIALLDDTVARNIAFGIEQPDALCVMRAAEVAQIKAFIDERLPDGLATRVGENGVRLSGGERQRLGIARAMYRDPALLVLDEATSALDINTERAVIGQIQAMGRAKTVLMVAHRLNTIRQCDWIFYFERGRVLGAGRFDELLATCPGFAKLVSSSHDAAGLASSTPPSGVAEAP